MTTALHESQVKPEHYFGWKPGLWDIRNEPADTSGLVLLQERDPRDEMPDPYDQLELGACTGNAIAGGIEYDTILNGDHYEPSRMFIYWNERDIEGTVDEDSGAFGPDGFKVARKDGVPPEELCPYDISTFTEKPSEAAFKAAKEHRIGKYVHPGLGQNLSAEKRWLSLQRVLSNKQTVAFGFTVYESFESLQVERTGIMPMPGSREKTIGGHEVLLVGYIYYKGTLYALVRNSWGTEWGQGGYFLMPLQYLLNLNICNEFRSIWRPAGA